MCIRDQQLPGQQWSKLLRHFAQLLRLDREDDDLTVRNAFGNVFKCTYREIALQPCAIVGIDFHHTDLCGRKSLAEQAADECASHVAAADEADVHLFFLHKPKPDE